MQLPRRKTISRISLFFSPFTCYFQSQLEKEIKLFRALLIISTFLITTSLIIHSAKSHHFKNPLSLLPPLLKSTQPFSTSTKIHSAFCHLVNNTQPFSTTTEIHQKRFQPINQYQWIFKPIIQTFQTPRVMLTPTGSIQGVSVEQFLVCHIFLSSYPLVMDHYVKLQKQSQYQQIVKPTIQTFQTTRVMLTPGSTHSWSDVCI